jgi:hypothetical protein
MIDAARKKFEVRRMLEKSVSCYDYLIYLFFSLPKFLNEMTMINKKSVMKSLEMVVNQ